MERCIVDEGELSIIDTASLQAQPTLTMSAQVKRKIPVPSFALPVTPNEASNDGASETKRVKLAVEMQRMINLENALQLHLHQQKQQAAPNSDAISFTDFSKISSKIDTSSLPNENNEDSKTELESTGAEELPDLVNLSRAERFWHDVYCIAVPDLYNVVEPTEETKDDIPRAKKRRRLVALALELKPTVNNKNLESKNRLGELRRLIREASTKGIPTSKSKKALSLLLALKQEKENQTELATASKSSTIKNSNESSIVDSLLRDTNAITTTSTATTIDDRIRARAKERERNLEQAKAARRDPREERVAIADALYSYACHILRRKQSRSRFSGTSNKSAASKKCSVTFQEIVQKSLPTRSRKEITRMLLDIVKVLSESTSSSKFLKWKDLKTGQAYGVPISKNASVTIDTSDFKNVREILNREKMLNGVDGK